MSYANAEPLAAVKLPEMFEWFWDHAENWIEEPNVRRKGMSGVIRTTLNREVVYVKKQLNHLHYSLRYPLGRPTALREADAVAAVRRLGINAPEIIYCDSRRVNGEHHTILVTTALEGYLALEDFAARAQNQDELDHYKLIRQASLHDIDQFSRHQTCWDQMHWQQFLDEYQKALSAT